MQPLEAGDPRTIGGYRLLGRLGAGGMGRVYLGRSAGGRTVAVKVVHPQFAADPEFRARFRREVAAARRVGGEWTAPVLDADPEAEVPWVAAGYVAGPSLDRAVAAHGALPEASVRAIGEGLARALVAVHALGLVHRDVKPSNVMLTLEGPGPRLIDFGIARATAGTASLTSTGVSVGSPGYMAPEQIVGKGVTGAADVFSLGAVLAFAVSGRPPFTGEHSAALLYKVVHEPPELDGIASDELRGLIGACLAKAPADRPAPAAIAAALDGALRAPGWLPASLVEEASRAAVALLHLDSQPAEGPASGPVPFTRASGGGLDGGPAAGGFGPVHPSYASAGADRPAYGPYGPPADAAFTGHAPTETAGGGGHHSGTGPAAGDGREGRHVSVTASGRRVSCTVVVAAAAVLAALSGGLYGLDLLPGRSGGGEGRPLPAGSKPSTSASPSTPTSPSPSPSPSPSTGAKGTRDTVPKQLIGTWKGPTTTNLGAPGRFEITIKGGRTGEVVARDKSVIPLFDTDCSGDWKLTSATDRSLVLDTSGGPNPAPGICSEGSAEERFTLNENGTLHYRSGDRAAGNPEGDLTRSP
ncbi:serine/threonine-protein kinase [Streptomyces sp. A1136]|uniref:serine/threonine-protein kinase n=1 Tax=Streptomyces sp. A1136 TaxID=2563102 RepID=UPI00109EA6DB|nr:serine/threonine-protein kinase [Streptomyces sp. A1136]THA56290.1 serine/threonine protein kinase [Streptomyces sp. A1136]